MTGASLSPDGRTVLTACGNTARLWDAAGGHELRRLPHDKWVVAAFSPDSRSVLTVTGATAWLWDAASGKELRRLTHDDDVHAASFSPDGRTVLSAGEDNTTRLWEAGILFPPDAVDPDRLRAWALVRTSQDFTEDGTLRPLPKEQWEQQRQTLDAKGGDWHPPPDLRQWHFAQAADAEADQSWFAARFHLDWLLKDDPNNADLLHRRDEAEAHLKAP